MKKTILSIYFLVLVSCTPLTTTKGSSVLIAPTNTLIEWQTPLDHREIYLPKNPQIVKVERNVSDTLTFLDRKGEIHSIIFRQREPTEFIGIILYWKGQRNNLNTLETLIYLAKHRPVNSDLQVKIDQASILHEKSFIPIPSPVILERKVVILLQGKLCVISKDRYGSGNSDDIVIIAFFCPDAE